MENNKRIMGIRTRSAQHVKNMFPCGRGALSAKSAGFKQIAKDFQQKNMKVIQIYKYIYIYISKNKSIS